MAAGAFLDYSARPDAAGDPLVLFDHDVDAGSRVPMPDACGEDLLEHLVLASHVADLGLLLAVHALELGLDRPRLGRVHEGGGAGGLVVDKEGVVVLGLAPLYP